MTHNRRGLSTLKQSYWYRGTFIANRLLRIYISVSPVRRVFKLCELAQHQVELAGTVADDGLGEFGCVGSQIVVDQCM